MSEGDLPRTISDRIAAESVHAEAAEDDFVHPGRPARTGSDRPSDVWTKGYSTRLLDDRKHLSQTKRSCYRVMDSSASDGVTA
jgi:hypothetical protein